METRCAVCGKEMETIGMFDGPTTCDECARAAYNARRARERRMYVIRGDGRIIKALDFWGAVQAMRDARDAHDDLASVHGELGAGYDIGDVEARVPY